MPLCAGVTSPATPRGPDRDAHDHVYAYGNDFDIDLIEFSRTQRPPCPSELIFLLAAGGSPHHHHTHTHTAAATTRSVMCPPDHRADKDAGRCLRSDLGLMATPVARYRESRNRITARFGDFPRYDPDSVDGNQRCTLGIALGGEWLMIYWGPAPTWTLSFFGTTFRNLSRIPRLFPRSTARVLSSTWCPGLPLADRGPLAIRRCVLIGAAGKLILLCDRRNFEQHPFRVGAATNWDIISFRSISPRGCRPSITPLAARALHDSSVHDSSIHGPYLAPCAVHGSSMHGSSTHAPPRFRWCTSSRLRPRSSDVRSSPSRSCSASTPPSPPATAPRSPPATSTPQPARTTTTRTRRWAAVTRCGNLGDIFGGVTHSSRTFPRIASPRPGPT